MKPTHILTALALAFAVFMVYGLYTAIAPLLARIPTMPTV